MEARSGGARTCGQRRELRLRTCDRRLTVWASLPPAACPERDDAMGAASVDFPVANVRFDYLDADEALFLADTPHRTTASTGSALPRN